MNSSASRLPGAASAVGPMHSQGRMVDPITVTERLKELKLFDELGGSAFLSNLVDSTPTTAHAEHYVELVHAAHVRRKIIQYAAEAQDSSTTA